MLFVPHAREGSNPFVSEMLLRLPDSSLPTYLFPLSIANHPEVHRLIFANRDQTGKLPANHYPRSAQTTNAGSVGSMVSV